MTDTHVPHLASRMADIEAFQVMDLLARARELEGQGRDIVHMEIGEPDFPTPEPIIAAAQRALAEGKTHYTPALGLPALREAIAGFYQQRYGVSVSPERIVITPGASGALLLALGVLLNPGEKVLLADPGYPCNRHFVRFLGGVACSVPVDADTAWQLAPRHIEQYWDNQTVAAMVASPSNPTGTLLGRDELAALAHAVAERGGTLIADEIYHGLTYPLPASPTGVGEEGKLPPHLMGRVGEGGYDGHPLPASPTNVGEENIPSPLQGDAPVTPSPLQGEGWGVGVLCGQGSNPLPLAGGGLGRGRPRHLRLGNCPTPQMRAPSRPPPQAWGRRILPPPCRGRGGEGAAPSSSTASPNTSR